MTQALPFPISQKETSEFPDPISRNLSLSSNHEISNTASLLKFRFYFLVDCGHCFYDAAFEGFDMHGAGAYDTEVGCRTDG